MHPPMQPQGVRPVYTGHGGRCRSTLWTRCRCTGEPSTHGSHPGQLGRTQTCPLPPSIPLQPSSVAPCRSTLRAWCTCIDTPGAHAPYASLQPGAPATPAPANQRCRPLQVKTLDVVTQGPLVSLPQQPSAPGTPTPAALGAKYVNGLLGTWCGDGWPDTRCEAGVPGPGCASRAPCVRQVGVWDPRVPGRPQAPHGLERRRFVGRGASYSCTVLMFNTVLYLTEEGSWGGMPYIAELVFLFRAVLYLREEDSWGGVPFITGLSFCASPTLTGKKKVTHRVAVPYSTVQYCFLTHLVQRIETRRSAGCWTVQDRTGQFSFQCSFCMRFCACYHSCNSAQGCIATRFPSYTQRSWMSYCLYCLECGSSTICGGLCTLVQARFGPFH